MVWHINARLKMVHRRCYLSQYACSAAPIAAIPVATTPSQPHLDEPPVNSHAPQIALKTNAVPFPANVLHLAHWAR